MDPVSGLSLAANILQFTEYAGKLILTAAKLGRSPGGALAETLEIEIASENLVNSVNSLVSAKITTRGDEAVEALCAACSELAQKLLTDLGTAKVEGKSSKWKVIRKAVRNVWMENDIRRMQERLGHLKVQLLIYLATDTSTHMTQQYGSLHSTLDSMARKFDGMGDKLEDIQTLLGSLGEIRQLIEERGYPMAQGEIEESIHSLDIPHDGFHSQAAEAVSETEETPLLADSLSSQLAQASLVPSQPLVTIRTPARPQCKETTCACSCHLRRYYKTPLFLKKFIGALAFRGVCQNHPTRFLEVKYWVPRWFSYYDIYLLIERTAHGTPSLGLKFRRKVPWGGEDTIIRFSFLGDTEGIKAILLSGRGSLDDVDPNHGRTPLHYAVLKTHMKACKFLLEAGADRFVEDESDMSATQKAWERIFTNQGTPETLDNLKALFPNNDLEYWGFSPLHEAVLGVNGLSLTELLKSNPSIDEINAVDTRRRTALHWAALRGDLNAVELLLEAGANVDAVDEFKCTPLLYAVSSATPRIVELLILRRANVNFANNRGDTPLHYAARHKDDVESVKILVRAGADVDRKNFLGNTPFAGAAITNKLASGKYLLQSGADRHSSNMYGDTPLRETVHHNCHAFLQMLLQTGTRYDDVNNSGSSILHALALEGDIKTIGILRTANMTGLDPQMRNVKGETATEICQNRIGVPTGFKEAFSQLLTSLSPGL